MSDGELAVCYICKGEREQNSHQYHDSENVDTDNNKSNYQQPAQIDTQDNNQPQSTGTVSENNNKTNKYENNNSENNVQHLSSEIRQKQLKLKKLEQDIKLKEKTLQDSTKDRTRLETRILQLETQNEELLGTIRTLKRNISVLEETKDTHCSQTSIPQYSSGSHKTSDENDLMFNIHQKVTKYILKQIDHQLDKLDIASNNEKEPTLNQNTSTNITSNETVQSPIVEKIPTTVPYGHYNVVTQNNPSVFNPNRQILHNVCGPPVQYMALPSKTNNTNSTYQMNKPVMRNPTRNSRTPWNKANIQRTTYNTTDIRKKTIEKNQVPKSTNNDNKIQLDTKTNKSVIIIDDESAQVGEPHFLEISTDEIDLK